MPFASPARLSTRTTPIAPACAARSPFETNVHDPRETSAIAPFSELAGSWLSAPFGSPSAPQRCRSTGWPLRPMIEPTSTTSWFVVSHAAGVAPPVSIGMWRSCCRPELNAVSDGVKIWSLETAATEIAVGRCRASRSCRIRSRRGRCRRRARARRRGGDVVHRRDQDVVHRLGLGPAARAVEDVHAVLDGLLERHGHLGRLGDVPDRRRHVEDPVVAEERLRRDAGEPAGRGMVVAGRRAGSGVAGGDARDVGSVERGVPVERQLARVARAGSREGLAPR